MIRIIRYQANGQPAEIGGMELLDGGLLAAGEGFHWVDFDGHDKAEERKILQKTFGIDPLAVDDAQRDRHPPKLEWFDDYFFLLMKGFTAETDSIEFGIVHVSFFVGANFIVTRHDLRSPSTDRIWQAAEEGTLKLEKGPNHICYRIVRTMIDRYAPIVLKLEKRLDELEELMVDRASDDLLAELVNYNSQLKKLRRIFGYQHACLQGLEDPEYTEAHHGVVHEFQDAREQMERLASLSGLLQELTRDLIDGYISISSHRLNNIMKLLTIASVIFLPLTFLAGIYGMNFEHMPELHSQSGYFVLLAVMGVIAALLLYVFRRMRWL